MGYQKKDTILTIDKVNVTVGGRHVLRDVSAEVKDIVREDAVCGQVVAFLGPSGIGKSTLVRVITGLLQPTSGTVTLAGGKPVHKGLVGMVPQNYPLFDYLTVRRNFELAVKQHGGDAKDGYLKMLHLEEQFGLHKYADYYPKALSGGTRQRAAIVRQLLCSEALVCFDEPFASLDVIMKRKACEAITTAANQAETNTMIIVSHDISEAMSVADTVWLMGLEPDPATPGAFLPGARIVEQYDLAAAGLCWRPDILKVPEFQALVAEVKTRFFSLAPAA